MAIRGVSKWAVILFAAVWAIARPVHLQAEVHLLAEYEFFNTQENTTAKDTGIVTDSDVSRFLQLYQLDIGRYVYPNLFFNLGGYFEQNDSDFTVDSSSLPQISADTTETTIRPYVEMNLDTPLYKAGLAYRKRDTESGGSLRPDENITVDEYDAILNWRPVDLPLLNLHFQRIEAVDDPLTFDSTRDTFSLVSKYTYRDYSFHYLFNRVDNLNNLEEVGNVITNHNGGIGYFRGFDYNDSRFDMRVGAKYIYETVEFTGANAAGGTVDTPADSTGTPFYILNDAPPTSNDPFALTTVDGSHPLTDVNIGRNGGPNPVSAGLSFNSSTQVDTVYIQLSRDLDTFPNLASPTQIAGVAASFSWQFYSSDDPVELNWTQQPIASVTYSSIDNRFEVRLAASVTARQFKITTIPLTVVAPGEIRYAGISAFTTVQAAAGIEPENFDQFYNFSLQWTKSANTTLGYEGNYRNQEARDIEAERTSLTNSLFFRHAFNPVFKSYGRVGRSDRSRTQPEVLDEDEVEHNYNLSLRGDYLDTLSQTLTYSGSHSSEEEGSSTTNSIILRTDADLYRGLYTNWSMNLDLGYAFNTLLTGTEQTVKNVRVGTTIEPHQRVNLSLDYSINWTDETGRITETSEYGTAQALWAVTGTFNVFFRYTFRNQEGRSDTSLYLREFNIHWAPFPDGAIQFTIGYNEQIDFADRLTKTISPTVTWQVARGIFLDLRYNDSTFESPTESGDRKGIIAKLRLQY